ncbi:hypothetical protein E8E13_005783 [Curvularia kusanoi]|uniref:Vacuolar protein sorting-associated protein 62 n=1 Tax=Curvularia kusanoi TaxID=90978 RepID=A0A9P4TK51_CURKU|nr:hypothetical protein E8E13_005783 [Curvularia kusanoi]
MMDVPVFAKKHAPLFYLHSTDKYHPTDLSTFLQHVRPQIDFEDVKPSQPALTLADLDQWNTRGDSNGENVYLTSIENVAEEPEWLRGGTGVDNADGVQSYRPGAIIVVERGGNFVDVFYFMFWAFNHGGKVFSQAFGNHVGDWEHVMIRFWNGTPTKVWLSQHGHGEAYTFEALEKNAGRQRPVLYVAKGSHAIYPKKGDSDHVAPNMTTTLPFLLVDQCSDGLLIDPLKVSYPYSYTPVAVRKDSAQSSRAFRKWCKSRTLPVQEESPSGIFRAIQSWAPRPGWLKFNGHWGDQEYDVDDPRHQNLPQYRKHGDGPKGPLFNHIDGKPELGEWLEQWLRKLFSGKKKMKVQGNPQRIYVDGTPARPKEQASVQASGDTFVNTWGG